MNTAKQNTAKGILHSFERCEKKYILNDEQFRSMLDDLAPYATQDAYGQHTICNIYYDTDDYDLIRHSLDKPYYKEKFRLRSYGVPGNTSKVFAEIKKKSGGIVYKRRVDGTPDEINGFLAGQRMLDDNLQIQNEIRWFLLTNRPSPKAFIGYERIALAGIEDPDFRITFDRNIRYRLHDLDLRLGDYGSPVTGEDTCIMEVKIKDSIPLWLTKILSQNGVYPGSFSKYGTCYEQHIARNIFKVYSLQPLMERKEKICSTVLSEALLHSLHS
jgi:hypothetical protein